MATEALPDRELAEGVVRTAGVTSLVYDDDGHAVGHVLLVDMDDVDLIRAVATAESLGGVSALWESSQGSYHAWGLSVREFGQQTLRALNEADADDGHVGASWRRGYAVLRLVAKLRADGEVYRTRPTLLDVFDQGDTAPQSRPHYELLRSLAADQGSEGLLDAVSESGHDWVGDPENVRLDAYQTLDDAAKERVMGRGD